MKFLVATPNEKRIKKEGVQRLLLKSVHPSLRNKGRRLRSKLVFFENRSDYNDFGRNQVGSNPLMCRTFLGMG